MKYLIYKPISRPTQSGPRKNKWCIELMDVSGKYYDPVMSWLGDKNTNHQVAFVF